MRLKNAKRIAAYVPGFYIQADCFYSNQVRRAFLVFDLFGIVKYWRLKHL